MIERMAFDILVLLLLVVAAASVLDLWRSGQRRTAVTVSAAAWTILAITVLSTR